MRRPLHAALLLPLALLASVPDCGRLEAATFQGNPYLVRDLNVENHRLASSTFPSLSSFLELAGELYFVMDDGIHGNELWKIDADGEASLVRDVCPGICSISRGNLHGVVSSGRILFAADDGEHGFELWISDGTPNGTTRLADIDPGPHGSGPWAFIATGTIAYFAADDGVHGSELWRSDGTPEGTFMVVDAVEGADSLSPQPFAASNGVIWLLADGELWRSDGTPSGTGPVTNADDRRFEFQAIDSSLPCLPQFSWALLPDGDLLFSDWEPGAPLEVVGLWRTDGTLEGTVQVLPAQRIQFFAPIGAEVLFLGTLDYMQPNQLWRTDGTTEGTDVVEALDNPWWLQSFGASAYFANQDATHGTELWTTDGTPAGTGLVADVVPGPAGGLGGSIIEFAWLPPTIFSTLGEQFLFFADDGTRGHELWSASGLGSDATLVADINPGVGSSAANRNVGLLAPGCPGHLDDELFFVAFDDEDGLGVWRTAGSTPSTEKLRDLSTQTSTTSHLLGLPVGRPWINSGSRVLFTVSDLDPVGHTTGYGLWTSDGTAIGSTRLTPPGVTMVIWSTSPVETGGKVFFSTTGDPWGFAASAIDGALWATDGTPGGTQPIKTFDETGPSSLTAFGDSVLFVAGEDGTSHLWSSDGSPGGTLPLAEMNPCQHIGLVGESFGATLGELAFLCGDEVLWRTDGTPGGTWALPSGARPRGFTTAGSVLYFSAEDSAHGRELWKSNGTPEGTEMVVDLRPGPAGALPYDDVPAPPLEIAPRAFGGRVYFAADDGLHGLELWSSDGTAEGTTLVADLIPGPGGSSPAHLTVTGGRLLFVAEAPGMGRELWSSDGTTAGTSLVADLHPGPGSSLPRDLTALPGGGLAFAAFAPYVGRELFVWFPGGAPSPVDLAPGPAPSSPSNLLLADRHLFFLANDNTHGFELWAWELEPPLFADGFESGDLTAWSAAQP
jgi:ELWxxDGT repeat protein